METSRCLMNAQLVRLQSARATRTVEQSTTGAREIRSRLLLVPQVIKGQRYNLTILSYCYITSHARKKTAVLWKPVRYSYDNIFVQSCTDHNFFIRMFVRIGMDVCLCKICLVNFDEIWYKYSFNAKTALILNQHISMRWSLCNRFFDKRPYE